MLVLGLGWTGSASAEKKRVGVPRFDGPQEATVRKAVTQVLKADGYDVVGAHEIDDAAKSTGAQLDSNDGFKAVAKELSISAFIAGEVSKKKAKLTVRNGADGSVSGEGSFGGANPNKVASDVRDGFSRRLGSAIERGRAPSGAKKPTAAPAPEAVEADDNAAGGGDDSASKSAPTSTSTSTKSSAATEEKPADTGSGAPEEVVAKKESSPPSEEGAVGPRALDIAVGIRGFSRSLSYNQDLYGALRSYKLALGPAVVAHVLLFPLAFMSSGFAANFGVEVNLEQAISISSSVPANASGPFTMGATFPTIIHDYNAGLRYRIPLPGGHEISPFAGFGEQAYSFRDDPSIPQSRSNLSIPDTIYDYVRVGADVRLELPGGVTAGLGAGYRYVTNQGGQIATPGFFPFLTVQGFEASGMLGYHITPSIEARFNVDVRRYAYAMNSDKTDLTATPPNKVAGGAIDQYVGFTLGAAYVFGGVAPGAASEEPAEAAPKKKKKHKKKSSDDDSGDGDSSGAGPGSGDSDE